MAALGALLQARERKAPAFLSVPAPIRRSARWVRPDLVAEVTFTEWTADGRLRHPSFQGLRQDKDAKEVRRELPPEVAG
jgi:bifunctional non-homologous end joining protein LigD